MKTPHTSTSTASRRGPSRRGPSRRGPSRRGGIPPAAPTAWSAALLAALLAGLVACSSDAPDERREAPPPIQVRTATAERAPVVYYDDFPGTVSALEEVQVRPQVAGYITRKHFADGAPVRRGQTLYTIDTRQYRAAVTSADADIAAAEADLALAEKDVSRYRRLAAAEAVAQQTLDQAVARAEARRQALNAARARAEQAATQLDYATVRAPIAGLTGLDAAKEGTQVGPGTPLLTTVSQESPAGVDFGLPQTLIPRLSAAEADPGAFPDSLLRIRLPGGGPYGRYGTVYALDRAVDPATGTLSTRLRFANPEGALRPGMNVRVEVLNPGSGERVTVPATALAEQMGEQYLFVRADTLVLRRKVRAGTRFRDRVVIEEGLDGGEEVLVAGLNRVRDSARVTVVSEGRRERREGAPQRAGEPE